jgi:hypothetical protein
VAKINGLWAGDYTANALRAKLPGEYNVRGTLDGYEADTEVAVVVNDTTTEVALELATTIVVPPAPPATEPNETSLDRPKMGAGLVGWLIIGGIVAGSGLFGKRKG